MTTAAADKRDTRTPILLILLAVQLALIGGGLSAWILLRGDGSAASTASLAGDAPTERVYKLIEPVPLSFGPMVVGTAQLLPGLAPRVLAGAGPGHGINGYIPPSKVQVQVSVEINNRTSVPAVVDPKRFHLLSGDATPIGVRVASIQRLKLEPDAAVEATLIFVAPRNGKRLRLSFRDTAHANPFVIDLGITSSKYRDMTDAEGHAHS